MAAAAAFVGYVLLSCGPLGVIFATVVAQKSFLVLLGFASGFAWLLVLLLVSALLRAFLPLASSPAKAAACVVLAVAIQEVARYWLWRAHRSMRAGLSRIASSRGESLGAADQLRMQLTYGVAQAGVAAAMSYVSWLPLLLRGGTYYQDRCPQMSLFAAGALCTLGMTLVHSFLSPLAMQAYDLRSKRRIGAAWALHLAAGLLSLLNLVQGGCVVAAPLLVACGCGVGLLAGHSAWGQLQVDRLHGSDGM